MSIGVFLLNVESDVKFAIDLIYKFQKINNKRYKIKIFYDYSLIEEYGYYDYEPNQTEAIFKINPLKCHLEDKQNKQRKGFIEDYNISSTILHEFGHFLDFKYNITELYIKQDFKKIELGGYAKTNIIEEFAELIVLYLTNPYLLRHIDKSRYKFLRNLFKSPTPCSEKRFLKVYNEWSDDAKEECYKLYGINVKNDRIII